MSLADEDEFVKVLYWGAYGTGKTTSMAYLANLGPVRWIRADKGLKSGPLRRLGVATDKIDPVDELRPAQLERLVETWRGELHDSPGSIAGAVLDTATELIARRVEVYTDQAWETYKTSSRKNHTAIDAALRYSAADTRDIYQPVTQEVSRLVRHLIDLPLHVAISAQTRRDVDEKSGHVQYGPAANPAVRGSLIGYCDIVIETKAEGFYEDGDEEQVIAGYPYAQADREGKDRYGVLPRILVTPTMDRVISYVRGDLSFKTDPVQARYRELLKARKIRAKAEDDEL